MSDDNFVKTILSDENFVKTILSNNNFVKIILSDDNFVKTILSDEKSASTENVSKYPVNVMGNERIGGWQRLPWGMRRFSWASQGQDSFPQGTKATKIAASHGRKTAFADVVGQVDSGGAGELW